MPQITFPKPKLWAVLTAVLIAGYAIFALATYRNYGITYDEEWKSTYGEYIIQWYASGFSDQSALDFWNLSYQPGFSYVIARLMARFSPLDDYQTMHLAVVGFAILGLIGTYQLASYLAGPLAGFLATAFLLLTPRFIGGFL